MSSDKCVIFQELPGTNYDAICSCTYIKIKYKMIGLSAHIQFKYITYTLISAVISFTLVLSYLS